MSVGYRPPYKRNVSRPPPSALLQVSYRYCSTTKNFNFRTHLANLHGVARPSKILAHSSFGAILTFSRQLHKEAIGFPSFSCKKYTFISHYQLIRQFH